MRTRQTWRTRQICAALLAAGAIAALSNVSAKAAPYEGRWCAQMSIGRDAVSERCDLRTIEECRREIVGVGGLCVLNPYYKGPNRDAPRSRPSDRQQRR